MKLNVLYFAQLQDEAGKPSEELELPVSVTTAADLYALLNERYAFSIPTLHIRAATLDAFIELGMPLKSGDTIAFIPPVSGG